ncbi:hypothetical protein Tco_0599453 [Tanacetum coccineum]
MESCSYWLDKVRISIWRDVRTFPIEEAYTTKYSIHPGADTMLCGFRLTNRWLSMKKDKLSAVRKYLAYSRVEIEYQGSSGLLLQPKLLRSRSRSGMGYLGCKGGTLGFISRGLMWCLSSTYVGNDPWSCINSCNIVLSGTKSPGIGYCDPFHDY